MYKSIFRPLLFHLDAEDIHNKIVKYLQIYRHLTPVRKIVSSSCHTETAGWKWRNLTFRNRVGLSAGFDKAASCFDELSDLGFGFIEVGTVTPKEVKGNPCPRIFRLPKEQALISRTGFNNPGKAVFLQNLKRKRFGKYILGININTNHPDNQEQAMTDILDLYCTFNNYADYYTINWGSIAPDILGPILITLFQHKQEYKKPVFLKLPADLTFEKANERTIRLKRTHDPAASSSTLRRDRIVVYSSVSAKSVQTSA